MFSIPERNEYPLCTERNFCRTSISVISPYCILLFNLTRITSQTFGYDEFTSSFQDAANTYDAGQIFNPITSYLMLLRTKKTPLLMVIYDVQILYYISIFTEITKQILQNKINDRRVGFKRRLNFINVL